MTLHDVDVVIHDAGGFILAAVVHRNANYFVVFHTPPSPPWVDCVSLSSMSCDCRFGGAVCGVCVETGCWSVDSSSCCLMLCSLCVLLCCFRVGFFSGCFSPLVGFF